MGGLSVNQTIGKMHNRRSDVYPKRRIKQTPSTSKFKGLTSSQIRKLQKEN